MYLYIVGMYICTYLEDDLVYVQYEVLLVKLSQAQFVKFIIIIFAIQ